MTSTFLYVLTAALLTSLSSFARAAEYPIGKPHIHNGMEIAAVYLQPVTMEPEGMMLKAEKSDI
ncbi:iron transporter, partial [Candidatus Glomeribacter gigasporarum]|uniref:iron transporter n=1 Tax=Candidatus Glomeribacter gigasporarum TaxID=132144 RepID=UPI0005B2C2D3